MKPEIKTVNNTDVIVGFEPKFLNRDVLTTFSRDEITRKRLNIDVFYDDGKYFVKSNSELHKLIEVLTGRFLLNHTGDDGEFISDMETKMWVDDNRIFDYKADEFYLDHSVLYCTGYHWYLTNEQGQRVSFSKDVYNPDWSFKWMENVLDDNGESDSCSEKYEFEKLIKNPMLIWMKKDSFNKYAKLQMEKM
tara:strand:+ start:58 stop:633 length:576 start_codon:yes stop_codon:yes gene_type:complete